MVSSWTLVLVKKTHHDVASRTSCGTRFGGRSIRAEDERETAYLDSIEDPSVIELTANRGPTCKRRAIWIATQPMKNS